MRRRSRCSECSLILNETRAQGERGGRAACCARGARLDQCRSLALARQGERGPLWVVADRQTAGRGRRGRTWISEPGNLYASLLLTEAAPPEHWPELSFVAALAVHDAVVEVAPDLKPRLAIKWPNDLLLAGAKFAGILIEGENGGGRRRHRHQLRRSSRGHGLSRDRSRRRRCAGFTRPPCSAHYRSR